MQILLSVLVLLPAFSQGVPQHAQSPGPPAPPAHAASPTPTPAGTVVSGESVTSDAQTLAAEGDGHFAKRSVGAIDNVADKHEIDQAIALYRKATAADPRDCVILAKLMRALHFRGAYTGLAVEAKKAVFEEGKDLGQAAIDRLEAQAKTAKGLSRVEFLRLTKGTPALYLWTAGHWGEWGLVRGKFAAARSGVASRLRDLSQTVIDLDPSFEGAAGYRLLGRLHAEAPKIIFFTNWVSKEKGLLYLRRAYQSSPNHPVTWFFLAEAILDHEPAKRDEALQLLDKCAHLTPRPDTVLEDTKYALLAKKRLDDERRVTTP